MPPARKSTRSSSRRTTAFKEPAALKRLTQSLETAQKALGELRNHTGRHSAQTTRNLHRDVSKFITSAKRDSGKFASALKKDFEQAQKTLTSKAPARSRSTSTSRARSTGRATAKRTAAKRATTRKKS